MNIVPTLKAVTGLIASSGVGAITANAIKATTPTNLNFYQKITIGFGSVVLSGAMGAMATDYVEKQIDAVDTVIRTTRDEIQSIRKTKN